MTKGCYTCRRRRIVCDNGLPTCRKCRDAGKECLGYRKPLVWVKGGVASRGRMMGLTFDDVAGDSSQTQSPHSRDIGVLNASHQKPAEGDDGGKLVQYCSHKPLQLAQSGPLWGLVDPLFQDMNWISRQYIAHYNERCAPYLALYDGVKNPYRDLIPFIRGSPVLAEVLSAVGALHYAFLSSNKNFLRLGPPPRADQVPVESARRQVDTLPLSIKNSSQAYGHYLGLKQRALHTLSMNISDESLRYDDRTLAAILVLILLDAIESGNGAWKYHLEGAKNIIKSRQQATNGESIRGVIEELDTFIVDNCLVMEIMGSTLVRPGVFSEPFYTQAMAAAVLQRLEKTAWIGCPAYLLEVIFFLHVQNYSDGYPTPESPLSFFRAASYGSGPSLSTPMTAKEKAETILHHIYAFDPFYWAQDMQSTLFLTDLSKRIALASAYKAAIYLLARRVFQSSSYDLRQDNAHSEGEDDIYGDGATLKSPHSQSFQAFKGYRLPPYPQRQASADLIQGLSDIPPSDEHFKCTIWLTFIAGAEATTALQRRFTLERLDYLWNAIASVNVQNAAWVLQAMWQKQQERRREKKEKEEKEGQAPTTTDLNINRNDNDNDNFNPLNYCEDDEDKDLNDSDAEFNWIEELDRSKMDWLFI